MSRHPQRHQGARGSLKWMLHAVNERPDVLQPNGLANLRWVSPLRDDDYAEYRDADALGRLGLSNMAGALSEFWPNRGPQWDGLATFAGGVVLAEAKAHIAEFQSPPSQAGATSARRISASLGLAQAALGVSPRPWTQAYYQYANRLAHLWWLRSQGVDARLLFASFIGDDDMNGPTSSRDWEDAFKVADSVLGLPETHSLSAYIHHVYPPVKSF